MATAKATKKKVAKKTSKKTSKKKASTRKKTSAKKASKKRKAAAQAKTRGLTAKAVGAKAPPADVVALVEKLEADGGFSLAVFRDPLGSHWQILASIPIDKIEPTPFQRDLSATHAKRLAAVIDRLDWFIDPVVAVPGPDGLYWTPNGYHRLAGMRQLGAKSIMMLLLPRTEVAYQILALNTEKAHNVKEKSLEVIRMARFLSELEAKGQGKMKEKDFAIEFEEPAYLTMGVCYEERGRFSGSAYNSVMKKIESYLPGSITDAIVTRTARAARLLEVDDGVAAAVKSLKEKGFDSPYLKAFVIARINPLRFKRGATAPFDETIDTMLEKLQKFDVGKVSQDQVAAASGPIG